MNIFYLSENPKKAAEYHCDSHVVKMPVESVQMLVTSRIMNGDISEEEVKECAAYMTKLHSHPNLPSIGQGYSDLYKTHYTPRMRNHPCSTWVRECYKGFAYVEALLYALGEEYTKRYGRRHKSVVFYESLPKAKLKSRRRKSLPVPLAVGDNVRYPQQPVKTYREFYKADKASFAKWAYTSPPYWWSSMTTAKDRPCLLLNRR